MLNSVQRLDVGLAPPLSSLLHNTFAQGGKPKSVLLRGATLTPSLCA